MFVRPSKVGTVRKPKRFRILLGELLCHIDCAGVEPRNQGSHTPVDPHQLQKLVPQKFWLEVRLHPLFCQLVGVVVSSALPVCRPPGLEV